MIISELFDPSVLLDQYCPGIPQIAQIDLPLRHHRHQRTAATPLPTPPTVFQPLLLGLLKPPPHSLLNTALLHLPHYLNNPTPLHYQ